jgi:Ca-activated chloride channel family protein
VSNEAAILALIENELGNARLFPVGIGNAPNDWLLRRSAELGRGSSTLIRSPGDIVESMGALFTRLDHPALADIAMDFSTTADVHPAALPDLYVGEPLFAVARLPDGLGDVKARGLSPDGEFKAALALRATTANAATGLSRLWARGRLEDFEDAMRRGTPETELKPAMLALALQHGLVSRYTSLVAVDRTPVRPEDAALAALRFDNAAPAGSLAFANGSTGARSRIGGGIALLLIGIALLRRREPVSVQPTLAA